MPHDDGLFGHRDPAYIRRWMPLAELVARLWFRVRFEGLATIPRDGPLIFVGNHSGGIGTPDTAMAVHGFWTACGPDREVYALVHPDIFKIPSMGRHILKVGGLPATSRNAMRVLERGASLLVYPGAGDEAYRPWIDRNRVNLHGRSAYVRLAMRYGAAIVPVVCLGGHETLVVLDDGRERARQLGLDQIGIERLPLTWSWPHGLALGSRYHLPFPARIDIRYGPPVQLDGFGPQDARDEAVISWCHARIEERMQATLDAMVAARDSD